MGSENGVIECVSPSEEKNKRLRCHLWSVDLPLFTLLWLTVPSTLINGTISQQDNCCVCLWKQARRVCFFALRNMSSSFVFITGSCCRDKIKMTEWIAWLLTPVLADWGRLALHPREISGSRWDSKRFHRHSYLARVCDVYWHCFSGKHEPQTRLICDLFFHFVSLHSSCKFQ